MDTADRPKVSDYPRTAPQPRCPNCMRPMRRYDSQARWCGDDLVVIRLYYDCRSCEDVREMVPEVHRRLDLEAAAR